MYQTLEVLGPEHEFSIVDETLKPLPIVDRIIKEVRGRIVNNVAFKDFSFGKELQSHVAEFRAGVPFESPCVFEETMHKAVMEISDLLERRFHASLLGLGMHPLLRLDEAEIWSHRDRSIYEAMGRIFDLRQHGWLNIQSYQLNLPYSSEREGVKLHNTLANIIPYLPAISAASPVYESKISEYLDSRLYFYMVNQKEVPSVTGEVIPEYVSSFKEYRKMTIEKYSSELRQLHAPRCIIGKEWLNSRGAIFRFDRSAIEIRIMDEQECVKSDVALSCFIRALLRGLLKADQDLPHRLLVEDFNSVIKAGLEANVLHSTFSKAYDVCLHFYSIALKNATEDEKKYLWLIKKRITEGNLSNLIIRDIAKRSQKTSPVEAIRGVYLKMIENLKNNEPYI
jgi:gamma-glutamyl:cysteine ligase YbdK (ATP-grasp superfamily)